MSRDQRAQVDLLVKFIDHHKRFCVVEDDHSNEATIGHEHLGDGFPERTGTQELDVPEWLALREGWV